MQFDQLKRREFISLLGGAAAWPVAAQAQQLERVRRIGVLMELAASDLQARSNVAALQRGLHGLGWREGSNLGIEYRWAPDDPVLVWKFAKELVELRCDVIVAHSSPVVATLLGQTRNIPIVFVSISDPIGEGFVASFARPGGNVTGFTNFESSMTGKWVELLKDIAPELTRVAFLFNPQMAAGGGSYFLRPIDAAASTLKVKSVMALVHDDDEIEAAFAALAREPGSGAVLLPDIFTVAHYQRVIALAESYRVPTVYSYRFMVERGGLISYGVDIDNLFERAATYVDRILKGAKPADLPVQAPTKFELVINQKTAKALGFTVPDTLIARAEDVIE
jgi:putative tryptophan/tyrosine transport system substrate-binding protein